MRATTSAADANDFDADHGRLEARRRWALLLGAARGWGARRRPWWCWGRRRPRRRWEDKMDLGVKELRWLLKIWRQWESLMNYILGIIFAKQKAGRFSL